MSQLTINSCDLESVAVHGFPHILTGGGSQFIPPVFVVYSQSLRYESLSLFNYIHIFHSSIFILSYFYLSIRREYWMAKVDESACFDSSTSSCVFYLSFCHPIPPEIGTVCYGSSVCQISTNSSGNQTELNMGTYGNFTSFHESECEYFVNLCYSPFMKGSFFFQTYFLFNQGKQICLLKYAREPSYGWSQQETFNIIHQKKFPDLK